MSTNLSHAFQAISEPSGSATQPHRRKKRPAPFSFRLSDEERRFLEEYAGNKPWGSYIREQVFGDAVTKRRATRRPRIDDHKIAMLLTQLGSSRIASNLNQLARAVNTGTLNVPANAEAELQQACAAVIAMREALIEALGLKLESEQ